MLNDQVMPNAANLPEAARMFGLSKTVIYDLLREGTIKAKKRGVTTLVLMEGLRRYVDGLPQARVGAGSKSGD